MLRQAQHDGGFSVAIQRRAVGGVMLRQAQHDEGAGMTTGRYGDKLSMVTGLAWWQVRYGAAGDPPSERWWLREKEAPHPGRVPNRHAEPVEACARGYQGHRVNSKTCGWWGHASTGSA
ncbi:MAG: hypothetical protein AMXMBFR61_04860 [Fimbriimonadales bacterium]